MSLEPLTFVLTEEHIELLQNSRVNDQLSEAEFGAAEIDPKRPYGNSDVLRDMAGILGVPAWPEGALDAADEDKLIALHAETPRALQVVLASGSFVAGTYRTSAFYRRDWKLVEE